MFALREMFLVKVWVLWVHFGCILGAVGLLGWLVGWLDEGNEVEGEEWVGCSEERECGRVEGILLRKG